MTRKVRRYSGGVYDLGLHVVWCPKYRRRVLGGRVAVRLRELIEQKATEKGWEIIAVEVMPDHVHVFVRVGPTDAPAQGGGPPKNSLSRHPSGCPPGFGSLMEGCLMQVPSILQGPSLTRLLQGAAVGAVVTMVVGFNWGGWSTESTASKRADEASRSAVVTVLAPICVDKFQHSADVTSNLVELKKVSTYMQGSFVEKGGWATPPGSDKANSAVASACATMLGNLK